MKKKYFISGMVLIAMLLSSYIVYSDILQQFSSLEVLYISQEPDPAEPNQFVKLKFKVTNVGRESAENVVLELLPQYPFSMYSGTALREIGILRSRQLGDEGVIVDYLLRVDKDALEGDNEIKIRYKSQNQDWVRLDPITVSIRTHDAILSIFSVDSVPEIVAPGKITDLKIGLQNVADSVLEYIKVKLDVVREDRTTTTLTFTEFPFSPLDSSNEKTIKNLKGGEKITVNFRLIADPDAKSKIYKVPLKIEYRDTLGNNYTKNNFVTLIIGSEPDMSIYVEDTEIFSAGEKGTVFVKFVNKGVNDIKLLYVVLDPTDEYELLSSDKVYVGNIDSDDYETAEFELFAKPKSSVLTLPLHIEYRDATNNEYTEDVELEVKLYSEKEAKVLGLKKANRTIGTVIVVVIVIGGLFAYRRYRKKSKPR